MRVGRRLVGRPRTGRPRVGLVQVEQLRRPGQRTCDHRERVGPACGGVRGGARGLGGLIE